MKVKYMVKENLACVEYNPKNERERAIIVKLNLVSWDIVCEELGRTFFSVKNKDDFESLKRWVNYCKTHDFYI